MKARPLLLLLVVAAWAAFAGYVVSTSGQLPERVATHFAADGTPNGWMTRSGHVRGIIGVGIGASAFIVAAIWLMAPLGGRGLNIPNKDYWFAPERSAETLAFLQRHGVLLAMVLTLFFGLLHRSIVLANLRSPASLPLSDIGFISGAMVVFTISWVVWMLVHFGRTTR